MNKNSNVEINLQISFAWSDNRDIYAYKYKAYSRAF